MGNNRTYDTWATFPLAAARGTCAVCHHQRKVRETPGEFGSDICLDCWQDATPCSCKGCDDIAVERGKCRYHFLGAPPTIEEERARLLAEHAYQRPDQTYPETCPGLWGSIELRTKIRAYHEKKGLLMTKNPRLTSPMLYKARDKK